MIKNNKLYYTSLLSNKFLSLTLTIVFLLGLSESRLRGSGISVNTTKDSTGSQQVQTDSSDKSKRLLIDIKDVKNYFNNNLPNREQFCEEMKKRYNSSKGESLAAWDYFYTVIAIEYERLKREKKKYAYILARLLPYLKELEQNKANDALDQDCSEAE